MFSVLSKIARLLLEPAAFLVLCCAVGVALLYGNHWDSGRAVLTAGVAGLLLVGFGPVTAIAVWILENRFPQVIQIAGDVDGVVILGGGERLRRGQIVVGSAARLQTGADIARRFPKAKLLFSGGVANSFGADEAGEAPVASHLLGLLGVADERLLIEDRARNTRESAMFISQKFPFPPGERWFLVTSAVHIPRAVGAFRKCGMNVIPYPVDYSVPSEISLFDLRRGMGGWFVLAEGAAREWIGLIAYRVAGYTSELLPGPGRLAADGNG